MPQIARNPAAVPFHYQKAQTVDQVRKSRNIIILDVSGKRKVQGDFHLLKTDPIWKKHFKQQAERYFLDRLQQQIRLGMVWCDPEL